MRRSYSRSLLFAFGVVLLAALITVDTPYQMSPSLLTDFFVLFGSVVIESLPFLVLGCALSAAIQIYVSADVFLRALPKQPVLRKMSLVCIGFIFPVCECGNVPLSRSLMRKGLSAHDAILLLITAPIINPITLLTTYQAFSSTPSLVGWRAGGALLCALVVSGFLARFKSHELLTKNFVALCKDSDHDGHSSGHAHKIRRFADTFTKELISLFPALLLGAGIAATLQVIVPRSLLLTVANTPLMAIAVMMVLAFVISICSNVDAFFALALAGIFPPGALLAFLLLGPIVDIKMLSLMRTTFSKFTIISLCVLVALVTMMLSLGAQYVF